jgi:alpha-L-rhamnosidase
VTYLRLSKALISTLLVPVFLHADVVPISSTDQVPSLEEVWNSPPLQSKTRAYWWWLNGNVTEAAITKDLEWMKRIGMGGGIVFDADGASQGGHAPVPAGPLYGSPEWRKLFLHAVREADRLGLEIGLNITSGWNTGGPLVTTDKAAKLVTWSAIRVQGPGRVDESLPAPELRDGFYRDTFVLACRLRNDAPSAPYPGKTVAKEGAADMYSNHAKSLPPVVASRARPIRDLRQKCAFSELGGSASDCTPLIFDIPGTDGERDVASTDDVIDISDRMDSSGKLQWEAPPGEWMILRFGYTSNGSRVSTASGKWQGHVLDYLDADALKWYWSQVIDPVIKEAGPLAGKSWTMIQTDSWELGGVNWTARFAEEFRKRRGYDIRPWMPVIAGLIVGNREQSNRFLADYRRTIADCIADNHYGTMASLAAEHGMGIQPESAGPHTAPVDGQMCYGRSTWPMSEFWVPSPHRPTDEKRFFVKQAASAAHTYGKPVTCAEGFTSIGPQWNDTLWSSQKPSFDHEACAGLNLVFWHAFTCSPAEMGLPGQEYFAGTHFNPQITWAREAQAFISYLNRCQTLLQRGEFVADVLQYYGDHVPNIARLKKDDPAKILPTHDYDTVNEEVLLKAETKNGTVTLPSGMSYRVLVLPKAPVLSLVAARKVRDLALAGALIVGPKPEHATGREDDAEVRRIADELWDGGRIKDIPALQALQEHGVAPDVAGIPDWIHRRDGDTEIYFLSNQKNEPFRGDITFRVTGKHPEFWDPVTGSRCASSRFKDDGACTAMPVDLPPYGSLFVIFRKGGSANAATEQNFPSFAKVTELPGPWTVAFDPHWGGPAKATFPTLTDWTKHPDEGIRNYSGTAVYTKTFDLPRNFQAGKPLYLDLGTMHEIADVTLNGKNLGTLWFPPYRLEITDAVKASGNRLEITVVNTWFNRVLHDQSLPKEKRLTTTNIRLSEPATPPASGLLGPVVLCAPVPGDERADQPKKPDLP